MKAFADGEAINLVGVARLAIGTESLLVSPYSSERCLCWSVSVTIYGAEPLPTARVVSSSRGAGTAPSPENQPRVFARSGGIPFAVETDRGRLIVPGGGAYLHGTPVVVMGRYARQGELLALWEIAPSTKQPTFDEMIVRVAATIRVEGTLRIVDGHAMVEAPRILTFS